jgi:hypothetical protein
VHRSSPAVAVSPESDTTDGSPSGVNVLDVLTTRGMGLPAIVVRVLVCAVPVRYAEPNASVARAADVHGVVMTPDTTAAPL